MQFLGKKINLSSNNYQTIFLVCSNNPSRFPILPKSHFWNLGQAQRTHSCVISTECRLSQHIPHLRMESDRTWRQIAWWFMSCDFLYTVKTPECFCVMRLVEIVRMTPMQNMQEKQGKKQTEIKRWERKLSKTYQNELGHSCERTKLPGDLQADLSQLILSGNVWGTAQVKGSKWGTTILWMNRLTPWFS